jgi:urea transport system substrate-binding protein
VTRAGTTDPDEVGLAILGMSYDAPEGIVTVDPSTRHTWRAFNIGRVNDDGSIKIIWAAQYPLRPVPYPRSRSKKDWEDFLQNLYTGWGRKWADPVPQTTVTGPP